ncbi:MAG: TetR/AcrR family transcriptional regulator [Fusobacteriaceae bacterium]
MDSKKERIKTIATIMFASKGIRNTTIRDIASSLNIALGGIYYYYKSKEHLLQEIMEDSVYNRQVFLENIENLDINFQDKLKLMLERRLNLKKERYHLFLFAKIFENGEAYMTFDEYFKRDQFFEKILSANLDKISPQYHNDIIKIGRFQSTAFTKLLLMLIEDTGVQVTDVESYEKMVDVFNQNIDIKKEVDLFFNISFKPLLKN